MGILNLLISDVGGNNLIERQLWVKKTLESIKSGSKILDAGAGECQYKEYCKHLSYESQDFNEYLGSGNNKGLQTNTWDTSKIDIVSDIINIPKKESTYDVILCTEVFEHIPDPILAIKEFRRLLKPGGELIITAPFCSLTHFAPYHYYSGFNKYFYEHHLTSLGFKITEISQNGDYSEYLAQEIRRLNKIYNKSPFYIKICLVLILHFIKRKRKLHNTKEIGCFGFHVRAIK